MTYLDDPIVLTEDSLSLVEELRSIREAVKVLKAREDEIRTQLLNEVDQADGGLNASGAPVIEVQRQSRISVNSKRLQALYEDVWKDCQTETIVKVLRIVEPEIEDYEDND